MPTSASSLLESSSLRDTQPRRLVLEAMERLSMASSHRDIYDEVIRHGGSLSLVTVYRILDALVEHDIVHKHPSSGGFILCSMHEESGHHALMSCESCGRVEEYVDTRLCALEESIAQKNGFIPSSHLSEIIGICKQCHS